MKKSLLIIPGYRLFPIETGAGVAQFGIIDELRHQMNISLLVDKNNVSLADLEQLKDKWPEVKIVQWIEIKEKWEQERRTSLMDRIKHRFSKAVPAETTPEIDLPETLHDVWKNAGILFYPLPEWRIKSLEHFMGSHDFDLVQTDLPVNLPLIAKTCSIKSLHVCHELKHKRFMNTAISAGFKASDVQEAYDILKERELDLISNYDHCLFFSDEDAESVKENIASALHVSPFPILREEFYSGERAAPKRLMFIGPESHGPNREGLLWFLKEILPGLDDPLALHVIGKWSEKSMKELSTEKVHFHGFVEDLQPFFQNSIMIVPVLTGAGIRTKILQAMAQKVPVLSTRFAAEGIPAREGEEILFFKNPEEFRDKLNTLSESNEMTLKAQEMVLQHFSQEVLGKKRYLLLDSI